MCDDKPMSTEELVMQYRRKVGKKKNLFYCPKFFLKIGSRVIGREEIYEKLLEDLVFEGSI